jgi:hypothetical protein
MMLAESVKRDVQSWRRQGREEVAFMSEILEKSNSDFPFRIEYSKWIMKESVLDGLWHTPYFWVAESSH